MMAGLTKFVSRPGTRGGSSRQRPALRLMLTGLLTFLTLVSISRGQDADQQITLPCGQIRPFGFHDAGNWNMMIGCGVYPRGGVDHDPESDYVQQSATFPHHSTISYLYSGDLWIGAVVGGDTLVSTGTDQTTFTGGDEFWPAKPDSGGIVRTGRFSNDEFAAVYTDTLTDAAYVGQRNPYDDAEHVPLGVKIRQTSYCWANGVDRDFIIVDFVVTNIVGKDIHQGWAGFYFDPDIYDLSGPFGGTGFGDDISGALDTLLYDNDPASRTVIAYCYDNNGDPNSAGGWSNYSPRGVFSVRLLASSIANPVINFNWWRPSGVTELDYGPRSVGTAIDPFRPFAGGGLGTPNRTEDKYYVLSHPEVDYHQILASVTDTSDGWLPYTGGNGIIYADTRFLYSFGPFDLPPDDSVTFTVALTVSDSFHVAGDDYSTYFDPDQPEAYVARLDCGRILADHRRADSVYRSGFGLPVPGPPVGLQAEAVSADHILLTWMASLHPEVIGYKVYLRDNTAQSGWQRIADGIFSDTNCAVPVFVPSHQYFLAVTCVDRQGRESLRSQYCVLIPARPASPREVAIQLADGCMELAWRPGNDSILCGYHIYRAIWNGTFGLYDSTTQLGYLDCAIESGVRYRYYLTTVGSDRIESAPSETVAAIHMARDLGILFYDLNIDASAQTDPYRKQYMDELFSSISGALPVSRHDIEDGLLSFKTMSRYSLIIYDAEKGGGRISRQVLDSLAPYLAAGGRALLIVPNVSTNAIGVSPVRTVVYQPGTVFHDLLHLDSVLINRIYISGGLIYGDLMGCPSSLTDYPHLSADMERLAAGPIPISGYIPMSGALFPHDTGVEVIYRYQSSSPDSIFHGQVNGLRYLGDDYRFVLFSFPLSLMAAPERFLAFRQALADLGVNQDCGDINADQIFNVADAVAYLSYLYRGGDPPSIDRADVNGDEVMDVADVLAIINRIFRDGPFFDCCSPD